MRALARSSKLAALELALALLGHKKGCARDFGFFALALPLALISGLENRRTYQHHSK